MNTGALFMLRGAHPTLAGTEARPSELETRNLKLETFQNRGLGTRKKLIADRPLLSWT